MKRNNDKLIKDFERELDKTDIPFKDLFKGKYYRHLYQEFLSAETKASLDLYLYEHFTQQQIQDGLIEACDKIPTSTNQDIAANFVALTPFEIRLNKISVEFHNLLVNKELADNYYCPDITKTPIVKTLMEVNNVFQVLKKNALLENSDIYKEAEIRAKSIELKLNDINKEIAQDIIQALTKDNDNIAIHIGALTDNKSNNESASDKWAAIKDYFNLKLSEIKFNEKESNLVTISNFYTDAYKIETDFIESIRKRYGVVTLIFNDENYNIVPENFTHNELLNFSIDENILKFYYLPTKRVLTDDEYNKMVETGFVGSRERALKPYSIIIFGAYYARMDLYWKLNNIGLKKGKISIMSNSNIKFLSDLIPYFNDYAKGFKDGYTNFLNHKIIPFLPLGHDKNDVAIKIFEFVTNVPFKNSWQNNHSGFTTQHKRNKQKYDIINATEDGQKQGYYYRCWQEIFSANHLYAPLFNKLYEQPKIELNKLKNTTVETEPLKAIWLPQAKISIEDFYKKGFDAGLWDENHNITCERGSIYGTGKALLGSLSVALKGHAVNSNIDYKIIGKAFCEAFKIELKEKTENPYKPFSSTNPKYIKELKRVFVAK